MFKTNSSRSLAFGLRPFFILLALALFSGCGKTEKPQVAEIQEVEAEPAPETTKAVIAEQAVSQVVQAAPSMQDVIPAALEGNLTVVEQALYQGYDPNQLDPEGRTTLMYAAFNGHTEVVDKLIQYKADVNIQDTTGSTALMFAASGPSTETVALLLEKGARIDTVDSGEHFSALMWAAAEGQLDNVKLLLKHNADTTLQDIDGDTAESFAAKAGHAEVAELLKAAAPEKVEVAPEQGDNEAG